MESIHNLTAWQEAYVTDFGTYLGGIATVGELFPPEATTPDDGEAGVREPRRPIPPHNIGSITLSVLHNYMVGV